MNKFDEILMNFNDESTARTFTDGDKYRVHAIVAYILPILFFVPYMTDKNSDFCRFHTNQALAWLICSAVFGLVTGLLGWIPLVGGLVKFVIWTVWIAVTVCFVYGVSKNYALKIPVISDFISFF